MGSTLLPFWCQAHFTFNFDFRPIFSSPITQGRPRSTEEASGGLVWVVVKA
ncbi:unnamed protein product [Prunus brigantina]